MNRPKNIKNKNHNKPDYKKIIEDNIKLHNAPGYAEFYDKTLGLINNSWERKIFLSHLNEIISKLKQQFPNSQILALDLGAGTGNLTLELLKAKIKVTSLDISQKMLERLQYNAAKSNLPENLLTLICKPVDIFCDESTYSNINYHLICACSFYHHLPDYLNTIKKVSKLVKPGGFLYLTHEPMHKNSISRTSKLMQKLDFKLWRLQVHLNKLIAKQENSDKYYDPSSQADYWDITTGCNQKEIIRLLRNADFDTELIEYDSKRSRILHHICQLLNTKTLFAIKAQRIRLHIS